MKNGWIYISAYLGFWIVLSESTNISSILMGLIISIIIYGYVNESYKGLNLRQSFKLIPLWIVFIFQLIGAIVVANFQVAFIVLSKDMEIQPEVIAYKTNMSSNLLRTILANAITLTPGTMSVDIEEDILWVHCLNHEYAQSIGDNAFEKTLFKIQEGTND